MFNHPRLNAYALAPEALKGLLQLESTVAGHLDRKLLHLVKLRASQINGCAYCLQMHSREALQDGERPERLFLLDAWHEAPIYDERERAALEWTETLTKVSETHAPRESFEVVKGVFSDEEIVWLSVAIGMINTWNRLAIGFRTPPELDRNAPH